MISPVFTEDMIESVKPAGNEGIIEPVQFADWVAPTIIKSDGKLVGICRDFKLTVSQAAKEDKYPLSRIQDLFPELAGRQKFTKLDLSQAYQQVKLDEASKAYTQ